MTPRDLGDGLRQIASRRAARALRAAPAAAAEPAPAPLVTIPPAARAMPAPLPAATWSTGAGDGHDGLAIAGGEAIEIDGFPALLVRRAVGELSPELDLAARLDTALAGLARRDPEEIDRGLRPAAGCTLAETAILDLETTGFWGCPIFLVGLLLVEDGRLVTLQLLARDYPEEAGILRAAARLLDGRRLLVTFNGKSYDVPCFRERAVVHRVRERIGRLRHVDVLHPARRRFRAELPDCRLVTLEREVVGIFRAGDVASREVPALYHEFAATGRAVSLAPVLHHSRVDLLTTACLFAELAG